MYVPSPASSAPSKLRREAEARLMEGSAPATSGWPTSINALQLLYNLASDPASADDALKLLHELQVHQVELDLQHEQMQGIQRELTEDLTRYRSFFESAPMACLAVGTEGQIVEGNAEAARLLETSPAEWRGRRIDAWLTPASRPPLLALLERLRAGGSLETCEVQTSGSTSRLLRLVARTVRGLGILVALTESPDRGPAEPA